MELDGGTLNKNALIRVWEAVVMTKATYGIRLAPLSNKMKEKWEALQKAMLVSIIGCFNARNKARFLIIGKYTR